MTLQHEHIGHAHEELPPDLRAKTYPAFLRIVQQRSPETEVAPEPLLREEIIDAACNDLRMQEQWQETPKYGEYERPDSELKMLTRLGEIHEALQRHITDEQLAEQLAADVESSKAFIEKAFGCYRGEIQRDLPTAAVFAVPTRISRNDERYRHEVTPFLPIAEYVDVDVLQRFVANLPPCIIESYVPRHGEQSHVLFTPVFMDMTEDMVKDGSGPMEVLETAKRIVNDAAHFAHEVLGARVMGLGAIIPALTFYGKHINVSTEGSEFLTTTGHGGTVVLVEKTVEKVMDEVELKPSESIGVIGAGGSIGGSIVAALAERFPDKDIHISDINPKRLEKTKRFCAELGIDEDRIKIAENNTDVIGGSTIIVSAATGTVDFDQEMPDVDLSGKVFIDDSQPVCFDRDQAEKRGASVLWVVGDGASIGLQRVDGHSYGGEGVGIVGDTAGWGCELEAQVVVANPDLAVREAVTPQTVAKMRHAFDKAGIRVAPFQSFGRLVELPKKQS